MAVVRVDQAEYVYETPGETVRALQGVSLSLEAGELACLFGASGSGKSTLLSLVAGLDVPSAGTVDVLGERVSKMGEVERTAFRLEHVGMVFQDHNLISQLTAVENVELLLRCRGVTAPRAKALEALESVGLAGEAHRRPPEMSGGQRQRVGIARAIAGDRPLVLCDEPTGSLDSVNGDLLFQTLRSRAVEAGVAVLVATHDPQALNYAHSELVMVDGVIVTRRQVATHGQ